MSVPDLPPTPTSLHQTLRTGTAELHEAVERRFAVHDLTARDGYAAFLLDQAEALLPVEAALERAGIARLLPDWGDRRRAGALRADLDALGIAAPHDRGPAMIPFASDAEALGAAYVLEGSRLGGAVLLRRIGPGMPDAFLRHGARSGLWQGFLARLAAEPPGSAGAVLRGARAAFARFLEAPALA